MSKQITQYKVATYTDFSEPHRKELLGKHKNFKTAANRYRFFWDIYHRIHGHRVWQEELQKEGAKC